MILATLALGTSGVAVAQTAPAPATNAPTISSPAASAPATAAQATYVINAGDELDIYVWGEERLQRTLRVLPDGTIAFPLVGQLRVQGLLPQAVERQISERLKAQYRGDVPNVTVSVRSPSGLQFSVMGKVRAPSTFTPGRYINVLDAISLAGGPAEFANLDNVSIIRRQGDKLVTLQARLGSLFRGGVSSNDIGRANIVTLMPGDIVIVP
ncbi:polysaccharide biosynthesis/export family protein [Sphingomonas sp. RS2018]